MSKKTLLITIALLLVGGVAALFFVFPDKEEPKPFLTKEQVINRIGSLLPEAKPSIIQDVIYLDKTHVYVPFIGEEERYGMSFWIWKEDKWRAASVDNTGEPQAWTSGRQSFVMWNLDPKDQISEMRLYLVSNRDFMVSEGVSFYRPRIEMSYTIPLPKTSFGVEKIPDAWQKVMKSYENHAKEGDGLSFGNQESIRMGQAFFDEKGKETSPDISYGGHSYETGNAYVNQRYLWYTEQEELEGKD